MMYGSFTRLFYYYYYYYYYYLFIYFILFYLFIFFNILSEYYITELSYDNHSACYHLVYHSCLRG